MDQDFIAVCRALRINPEAALPPMSQARLKAERAWKEIVNQPVLVVVRKRKRPAVVVPPEKIAAWKADLQLINEELAAA